MILLFYRTSSQAIAITILLIAALKFYSDKTISQMDYGILDSKNMLNFQVYEPVISLDKKNIEVSEDTNIYNSGALIKHESQIVEFNLKVSELIEDSKINVDIGSDAIVSSLSDSDIIDDAEGFDNIIADESFSDESENTKISDEVTDKITLKESAILSKTHESEEIKLDIKNQKKSLDKSNIADNDFVNDIVVFDYTEKNVALASNVNSSKNKNISKENDKKVPSKTDFDSAIGEMQELMFGEKIPESRIADSTTKNSNSSENKFTKKNQNIEYLKSSSNVAFMSQSDDILQNSNDKYSSLIENLNIKPEEFNSTISIDPIYISHNSIKLDPQIKMKTLTRNVLSDEIYEVDKTGIVDINQKLNKNSRQYLQIEAPQFVETRLEVSSSKNINRDYHPVVVSQLFLGELYAKLGLKGEYGHVLVEVGDQEVDVEVDRPNIKIYFDANLNEVVAKDAKYIMFAGLRPGIAVLESYNKELSSYKVVFVKENTILYEEIFSEIYSEKQISFMTKLAFAKEESPAILKQSDVVDEFSGKIFEKISPNQFKTFKKINLLSGPEFVSVNFQNSNTLLMVEDVEERVILPTVDFKKIVYDVFEILNPEEACIIEYDLKNTSYVDYLTEIVNVKKIGKNNYSYESQTYSPLVKFVERDGHFNNQISKTTEKMLLFVDADEANVMISSMVEDDQVIHKNIVCEKGSWIKL